MKKIAQSTIEFSICFVIALLFLILTCNLFVWLNHAMVDRQRRYETTRIAATQPATVGTTTFLDEVPEYNFSARGGYQ
jgi:hypothetical protein